MGKSISLLRRKLVLFRGLFKTSPNLTENEIYEFFSNQRRGNDEAAAHFPKEKRIASNRLII
ncbi:unnamed protein product, partial [Allacma fusca]